MFVHLRTHSAYSLLEGAIRIDEIVNLCIEHKMPAIALTDSNNLFGALEFSEYAANNGIQPIIGCSFDVHHDDHSGNILLLAKNHIGYINLMQIVSHLNLTNIDLTCLAQHSKGIIALTGGAMGILSKFINNSEFIEHLIQIFKNNIYIELERHNLHDERELEPKFIEIAMKYDIPLVATNNVFFATRDMCDAHDALLCVAHGKYIVESDRFKLNEEYYFKSAHEMIDLFADIPEAIENTIVIAKRCSTRPEGSPLALPHFTCTEDRSEEDELRHLAYTGLETCLQKHVYTGDAAHDNNKQQLYQKRLEYELNVIIKMNYCGYFLIVSDFIRWSKNHDIPVGPGRGSGAGSVVAWALSITDLDPIHFGLLFERFLNPDRVSMPDFDIDFCQEKRDLVIEYVRDKYGNDHVAQIITFGTLQPRAVLRDVGRVLQMPYNQVDQICKMIPNNPAHPIKLAEAIELDKNLQKERDNDETIANLLDIGLKLEGLYRHVSTHAAGIVISAKPLNTIIPLYYDKDSDLPITGYSMKYVEKAGLVKFDFLGLKTLTVIHYACKLINDNINISTISLCDQKTFDMLALGDSIGVFQLESSGIRDALKRLRPDTIEDIIALISLYRPGPMDNIQMYINRKHGIEKPDYLHPMLEKTLTETFGVIIYQEQVMEIARVMAGYSLAKADLLRRAMGKKIKEEMDLQRQNFINGAVENKVTLDTASSIFDLVAKFAGYGFNKSHATGYALISYQTAYLKANYPLEFFTASLNIDINNTDKINLFCSEARKNNISILTPDINHSQIEFSIEGNAIRYGLAALKGIGSKPAEVIVNERKKNGIFANLWNLLQRIPHNIINKKVLESLAKSGAFDQIHMNRNQIFQSTDALLKYSEKAQDKSSTQVLLFDESVLSSKPQLTQCDNWDFDTMVNNEFQAIGFYLNNHPLDKYRSVLALYNTHLIQNLQSMQNHQKCKIAAVIIKSRIRSSNTNRFAILQISDTSGITEISIHGNIDKYSDLLSEGMEVMIDANIRKDEGGIRVMVNNMADLVEYIKSNTHILNVSINEDINIDQLSELFGKKVAYGTKIVLTVIFNNGIKMKIQLPGFYCYHDIEQVKSLTGVVGVN